MLSNKYNFLPPKNIKKMFACIQLFMYLNGYNPLL